MGCRFSFSLLAENKIDGYELIDKSVAEVTRIEHLISSWSTQSETATINAMAGIRPVKVSVEMVDLITRAYKISKLTQGAFDICFGSVSKELWHFDGKINTLPTPEELTESVRLINYKNIIIDHQKSTVFLKEKGMRIGFGAMGKGYAADKVKHLLQNVGVENAVINAGGDLIAWGNQGNGEPWTIGIANPDMKESAFSYIDISDMALVTSGNYEKFAIIDGKRYCHIIDPRTGMPVEGLKSVSVISQSAELADALATAVFVLGKEVGIDMINQLRGVACFIIDSNGDLFYTDNISQ